MANIALKVALNILIQDASSSRPNFGTIAVVGYHGQGPNRLVYDTTPDGRAAMVTDGFSNTSDAYRKNAAIGGQPSKVKSLKFYNRAAPNDQAYTLTPTNTTEGIKQDFELNGVAITHTNGAAETIATICAALQTQLAAITGVDATDNTTDVGVALTDATSGERMYFKGLPAHITIKDTSTDAGIATDLDAAQAEDPDFYGVLIDSMSEAENNAAAAWCQANGKQFYGQTIDSDVLTAVTTDVGSDFKGAAYTYAGVFYSGDMPGQFAAALMGRQFSRDPGSTNWENKQLPGITADNLTGTQIANAVGKNVGLYMPFGGLGMTHNIKAASGRFFDLTRDKDWLQTNAQFDCLDALANAEKIPFTQAGIDTFDAVLRARFINAERRGILDAGWDIKLKPLSEVLTSEKATRLYSDPADAFNGLFQGAINGVDIGGVLAI